MTDDLHQRTRRYQAGAWKFLCCREEVGRNTENAVIFTESLDHARQRLRRQERDRHEKVGVVPLPLVNMEGASS